MVLRAVLVVAVDLPARVSLVNLRVILELFPTVAVGAVKPVGAGVAVLDNFVLGVPRVALARAVRI